MGLWSLDRLVEEIIGNSLGTSGDFWVIRALSVSHTSAAPNFRGSERDGSVGDENGTRPICLRGKFYLIFVARWWPPALEYAITSSSKDSLLHPNTGQIF